MIRGLGTVGIVQVACGFQHSLVLTDSGRLFSFGDNTYGQLGLGPSAGERVLTPQPMECMSGEIFTVLAFSFFNLWQAIFFFKGLPIKSIACGGYHSVVITGSGAIYSWGRNNMGQLGLGDLEDRVFPAQVKKNTVLYTKCCPSISLHFPT